MGLNYRNKHIKIKRKFAIGVLKKKQKNAASSEFKKKTLLAIKRKVFWFNKKNVNYGQFVYIGLIIADYSLIISLDECIDLKNKFYLTENVILQINIRYRNKFFVFGFFFYQGQQSYLL